ncbi:hypothetical protein K504DRAFT_494482 [Pleomassaria siparia CBS 279.74]|uniref:Heterokaryon incompatibility domain-containing protein n=1 Tax=Pleomassaria siparia CBS 279.74 TaxID=1314801 RepID=A0A6G1JWZ8_9PLEO|nr:hypothetical protein K504DRAFT_494482 [Pleomassaria siparia CBS 279.74]
MGEVYSNSYCNIAAAHAADGTHGCFIERDPRLVKPLKVELDWGPKPGTYYAIQWLYWPRLPPGVGRPEKSLDPHLDGAALRRAQGLSNVPRLDAFSLWDRIVYNYSSGKLTNSTDKLVALSLWIGGHDAQAHSIPARRIQWAVYPARPDVYTAPSWSWASMHGAVEDACVVRHADDHEIVLEIIDVRIDLVSDINPFGRVRGGSLRVRGHLAKTGVCIQESPNNRGSFRLLVHDKVIGRARIDNYKREVALVTYQDLYYLPVRHNPRPEEANRGGHLMLVPGLEGPILQETNPDARSEFIRVGTFNVYAAENEFQAVCRQNCAEIRQDRTRPITEK